MIHGYRFFALGCTGHIRIADVTAATAQSAVAEAVRWLRGVEAKLSRYRDDSVIGRLNAGETVDSDANLSAVLVAADRAYHLTAGRFDATALPLWKMWHDPTRTTWPTASEIADVQSLVAWSMVEQRDGIVRLSRPHMALDLGGPTRQDRLIRSVAIGDDQIERLFAHERFNRGQRS